jgi:LPS sulfotransferase NodH
MSPLVAELKMTGRITAVANAAMPAYFREMGVQEIRAEVEAMPADERRRLAAFLVSLRHKDLADYRARMAQKIDDDSPENWVTLEEMDHRLTS